MNFPITPLLRIGLKLSRASGYAIILDPALFKYFYYISIVKQKSWNSITLSSYIEITSPYS